MLKALNIRFLRAAVVLVTAAVAACASCSSDSGSGSESNFLPCATDADCPRGACINEICDPDAVPASIMLDASDAAEPPDGTSSSGGTGGTGGGTADVIGAPDVVSTEAEGDATTSPGTDASSALGCGPGPTALYLMVDRSVYMAEPVGSSSTSMWAATASGIISFLQSPLSTGLDAAIQYFPLPDPCNLATYATPDVPFGPLPGNESALTTSIGQNDPSTPEPVVGRPVVEAFQSVMSYSKTSSSSSGDDVAVVIITNGYPLVSCNPSMAEVANIAEDGMTTAPAVRTFVIAIARDTILPWQYDQVTMAGGTGPAFLIPPAQTPGELTTAVTDALVRIAGRACEPCTVAGDCAGGGVCSLGYCANPN